MFKKDLEKFYNQFGIPARIFALVLAVLAGFAGCQNGTQTSVERVAGNNGSGGQPIPGPNFIPGAPAGGGPTAGGGGNAAGGSSIADGGSHTGGGSGVNGVPLEGYRIKVEELEEYRTVLSPLLVKLNKKMPYLTQLVRHILRDRKWYLVPVELNQIPAGKIGAPFKLEQIALQTKKEIWISTLYYSKANKTQQAILLMHEILVGVRAMEFQDDLDKCLAYLGKNLDIDINLAEYKTRRLDCYNKYKTSSIQLGPSGTSMDITTEDYEAVRSLTTTILDEIDSFDAKELEVWLEVHKFIKNDPF